MLNRPRIPKDHLRPRSFPSEAPILPRNPTTEFTTMEFADPISPAKPTVELQSHTTLEIGSSIPPPFSPHIRAHGNYQGSSSSFTSDIRSSNIISASSLISSESFLLESDMRFFSNKATPLKIGLIGFLFALLLLMVGVSYGWFLLGPTGHSAEIRIPSGARASQVGQLLQEAGLVRSGQLFALYLRYAGLDTQLRSGLYRLEGKGIPQVARTLTDKNLVAITTQVTFPEGWRADQMAARLSQSGFDGVDFLKLVKQPSAELRPKEASGASLEGFLFPATYNFPPDATTDDIVKAMLERMKQELKPDYHSTLAKLKLSVQDWITLASMVQAEAANPQEMPVIAGIFLNRLEIGQGLQSDPTVAYALGKDLPQLDRGAGDFEVDSPYNTYKYAGLPPGAISNPGSAALQSVLRPKRTNDKGQKLFYFLHAQGKIFVNVDFQGHLRDTARYR